MYTATKDLMLPATVTGSWPRPRWFDACMWGKPIDTCMMDVKWREQFQDAMSTVISDQVRAGLDLITLGDYHLDEDFAGRSWHHFPLQRWTGLEGDLMQPDETTADWLRYPPGTLLNEIYTAWRWPHVTGKIDAPVEGLGYDKMWRMGQARTHQPIKFGTCSAQVMGLFLDIHTDEYKDKEQVVWDMSVAMNKELLKLKEAGATVIQIEEPCLHFMANTFGKDDSRVRHMIDCFNREVEGLDDVEIWIHTCWGNPNMQRVMDETSYAASIDLYLNEMKGDVWTVEMCDRKFQDMDLFSNYKGKMPKKLAIGGVSHRTLQADRPNEVAERIRGALKHLEPSELIVSSDCGFGRQGCNREIAFYKASAIAQGCNIVRAELGLPTTEIAAADPKLQTDVLIKRDR